MSNKIIPFPERPRGGVKIDQARVDQLVEIIGAEIEARRAGIVAGEGDPRAGLDVETRNRLSKLGAVVTARMEREGGPS